MKLQLLLLILYAVKNKIEIRAKKRWYYKYIPVKVAEGFTLVEILITLLIIGVVASIIIPPIIQDTQDAELKTAYKKAFAVASQIIKQCNSEYLLELRNGTQDGSANGNNFDKFMTKFSVQKKCMNNNNDQCWDSTGETSNGAPIAEVHAFIDSTGMAWSARCPSRYTGCGSSYILVDTNGFKLPNKYGRDRWVLQILNKDNERDGMPIKAATPFYQDYTTKSIYFCPTPPCHYNSWLSQ